MGDDQLMGRARYLEILAPADDIYPQNENEERLKEVIHRLKDFHELQGAELAEARHEIARLNGSVADLRLQIENIETEERVRRREELARVTGVYEQRIVELKEHADELIEQLRASDETIRGKDQDINNRDNILEQRGTELKEKENRISELTRDVGQVEKVLKEVCWFSIFGLKNEQKMCQMNGV